MSHNITIQKGDVKTTLKPKNEGQELITETLSDIKESGMPSNEQLDDLGDKLWELLEESKKNAPNKDTKKIVETTQDVVTNIKEFVREKNYDGTLQEIARKLKESVPSKGDVKDAKEEIKGDAERIKDTLKKVANMIYDISKEMINDSEFRDMLVTILDVTQSSFKYADEKTKHLDVTEALKSDIKKEPYDSSKVGKPPLSTTQQPFGTTSQPLSTTQQPFGTTSQPFSTTQPFSANVGGKPPSSTTQQPFGTTYQPFSTTQQPSTGYTSSQFDVFKDDKLKDDKSKNVTNTNTEQVLKEKVKQMKKYMELSEEEKDKILKKVSAALLRLKKHPEYRPLIQNLFTLYDELLDIWMKIEHDTNLKTTYKESESVLPDIKKLIERASNRSLDHWIDQVKKLDRIRQDPLYVETRHNIEELLFDQKFQSEEDIKRMFERIKENLNNLNDRYENVLDEITHETKRIVKGIGKDTQLTNISENFNKLIKDIFTDKNGKPTIEAAANSVVKIKDVFFPILKNELAYVAFPIIEVESKNYFFRVENFNLHLDHIIPDQLKIETDSKINIDLDRMKRHGDLNFRILLDDITTKVEDLKFSLKKKTGIKYSDHGYVNISVKGATIDFLFAFKLREDVVDKIEVNKIDVNLHGMKIDILETKHEFIDSILTTVFLPVIRGKITKNIEDALYDLLQHGLFDNINEGLKKLDEKSKK